MKKFLISVLIAIRDFIDKDPGTILGTIFLISVLMIIFLPMGERWYKGKRRRDTLRKAAESLSFAFSAESDFLLNNAAKKSGLWDYLSYSRSDLELLGIHREKIRNVICNLNISHGEMKIFDFYYMGHNKSRVTAIRTCALAEYDKDTNFPHFVLRPKDFISRLNERLFGPRNADFAAYQDFSKKYILHCWDKGQKEEALRLFSPALIMALETKKDVHIFANGRYAVYLSSDGGIKPAELASFAEDAKTVLQMIYSNLRQHNLNSL